MGSEKTEVEKETINNQIGQLSTQSKKIKTIDLLRRQIRRGQTKKTAIVHRKKLPQRKENDITEVYIPEVKVQKNETKKRKSTSKLLFDIEWKNQNRNIIPNIMNQMLSFVQKRHKSERLTAKLFLKYEHDENWTISKYYCYMKRMKATMGHYINENELNFINKIHEPDFELYSRQEQMFYLKICRISVEYFFKTESILVSLTSNRMSQKKRKAHLIARRALLNRVQQLLKEATY